MAKNDAPDDARRARLAAALRANLKRRKGRSSPQPAERHGDAQEQGDHDQHDA